MDDFLQSLREDFRLEANELLDLMESALIQLEQGLTESDEKQRTEEIYRATHSLKGAARSVNYPFIEQLCMSLEEVWRKIKNGQMQLQVGMFGPFHAAVDLLRLLVEGGICHRLLSVSMPCAKIFQILKAAANPN